MVAFGHSLKQAGQGCLVFALRTLALFVLWWRVVVGYAQSALLCQVFDGFDKRHPCMRHEKRNGIAIGPATEAVIKLFGRANAEGRGFFAVERAQSHEVRATLFELDVATHHFDHIDTGQQFLKE